MNTPNIDNRTAACAAQYAALLECQTAHRTGDADAIAAAAARLNEARKAYRAALAQVGAK